MARNDDQNPTSLYTTDDRTIRLNQDKTTFVFPEFSIGTTPIGAAESVAARVESVAARQMSSSGLSASTREQSVYRSSGQSEMPNTQYFASHKSQYPILSEAGKSILNTYNTSCQGPMH